MDNLNTHELVERLGSDEDGVRKMAAFKLQSAIGDPSFADVFASEGGLPKLKHLCLHAVGNTLAYSLTSFSNLLDIDKGWDFVDQTLIKRVVHLVVTHPLVNILRGAMSILVAVVSHSQPPSSNASDDVVFGFRALRPAVAASPDFLEMLVSRLSSADHALCANALQLINSLVRDAIANGAEHEWPRFITRLRDLGFIRAAYALMQSTALQDLAQPLLEFQALTKVVLRKWRHVPVDLQRPEHLEAAQGLQKASKGPGRPDGPDLPEVLDGEEDDGWKRLGFENEALVPDFEPTGFLGMLDLTDYVHNNEDNFQRLLLEQSTQTPGRRCPIARASISVTAILYEHFEIDKSDLEDAKEYLALDSRASVNRLFKPMLLQWSKLHTAGLQAFLRLWKATGAETKDFGKVAELVRILLEAVVGSAVRTKEIGTVEDELANYDYQRLRELQMELIELTYEDSWSQHLRQVRDELSHEALQFIKEQRIRCLLAGAWFPKRLSTEEKGRDESESRSRTVTPTWRFVKLSHNRRWLHYADYESQTTTDPPLEDLTEKIDLSLVSSVVSNVAPQPPSPSGSTQSLTPKSPLAPPTTRIVINAHLPSSANHGAAGHRQTPSSSAASSRRETPLLTLHPPTHTLASEWLDGLLMLLDQTPITRETKRLLGTVGEWGLRIRLLNVRFGEGGEGNGEDGSGDGSAEPSRDGLDDDYYYDVFGGI